MQIDSRYLGDGVYASFDGFQIWLRAGSHDSEPLIALEPATFEALCAYASLINATADTAYFSGNVNMTVAMKGRGE